MTVPALAGLTALLTSLLIAAAPAATAQTAGEYVAHAEGTCGIVATNQTANFWSGVGYLRHQTPLRGGLPVPASVECTLLVDGTFLER